MPPEAGNQRREALRGVFHAIVRRTADWPADALLIAGDLFDLDRLSRETLAFLRESLESIQPIPVFIAPGDRDPFVDPSPYANETWPANVHIFNRPMWTAYELEHQPLTVHGFAFDGPTISTNPFGTLTISKDERIHVAVAHGSERTRLPEGKEVCAPFLAQDAATEGLHYLALGHYHTLMPVEGDFATRIYYAGAPESHGFDEAGQYYYLEVEIEQPDRGGATVQVTPVPSSQSLYGVHVLDCAGYANTHQLLEAIRRQNRDCPRESASRDCPCFVLRVLMTGVCSDALRSAFPAICEMVGEDFAFLDIEDRTQPADEYADLSRDNTALGVFVRRMNAEIADAPDDDTRRMLGRAREAGLAAYRGRDVPVLGVPMEAP